MWRLLRKTLFASRYETSAMLKRYLEAQYGHFQTPQQNASEPFYAELRRIASRYVQQGAHCLDIGCATGRLVFEWAHLGADLSIGIDSSSRFVKTCTEIQNGVYPSITRNFGTRGTRFIHADVMTFPLPTAGFSFISCINVIDRVPNPHELVAKIHELLAPHGIALLCDPYDWTHSPAPRHLHVSDIKAYLRSEDWECLEEYRDIPYRMGAAPYVVEHVCHVVVIKKRERQPECDRPQG